MEDLEKKALVDNEWRSNNMEVEIISIDKENSSCRQHSVFKLGLTFSTVLFAETLILALLAWIISLQLSVDIKNILDSDKDVFKGPYSGNRDGESVDNCCTAVDVNQVLKKFVEETVDDYLKTNTEILNRRSTSFNGRRNRRYGAETPKAHLHPDFPSHMLPGYNEPKTLTQWATDTQDSFLDGMRFSSKNGHVTVSVSGFYYIYCQVSYRYTGSSSSSSVSSQMGMSSNIVHDVMMSRDSSPTRTLMSNTESRTRNEEYSSFMSIVVNLFNGDEIFLRAEVPGSSYLIDSQRDATYLGMILLDER